MKYQKNIDEKRAVMVDDTDDGMIVAGVCNNGYQWSTITTYSPEMIREFRDALTAYLERRGKHK